MSSTPVSPLVQAIRNLKRDFLTPHKIGIRQFAERAKIRRHRLEALIADNTTEMPTLAEMTGINDAMQAFEAKKLKVLRRHRPQPVEVMLPTKPAVPDHTEVAALDLANLPTTQEPGTLTLAASPAHPRFEDSLALNVGKVLTDNPPRGLTAFTQPIDETGLLSDAEGSIPSSPPL